MKLGEFIDIISAINEMSIHDLLDCDINVSINEEPIEIVDVVQSYISEDGELSVCEDCEDDEMCPECSNKRPSMTILISQ